MRNYDLRLGSNLDVLPTLADNSVDAIVTDPPYELGFMGKSWDSTGIAFNLDVWRECLRVLKPGGHLLAFSGSRTYHRMAVAIEDAGFQIRDQIMWIYGSGFPKSLDVSKAIDNQAGSKRADRVIAEAGVSGSHENPTKAILNKGTPVTPEAQQWQGWGTALKPAHEPIVLARKPLVGTVAANVLEWGTGGLNIDGSRVGTTVETWPSTRNYSSKEMSRPGSTMANDAETQLTGDAPAGRFPANVIHDGLAEEWARYFYCAKASKRDRNEGLEGFEAIRVHDGRKAGNKGGSNPRNRTNDLKVNHHPTVKPTDLMRYLCKLITPPGGTVLDPFMGSGSTGKGAIIEGFDFIGIELSEEYLAIAKARIEFAKGELQ